MHVKSINIFSDLYHKDRSIIPCDIWLERGVTPNLLLLRRSIAYTIPIAWKQKLRQGFDGKNCVSKVFTVIENDSELSLENLKSKKLLPYTLRKKGAKKGAK